MPGLSETVAYLALLARYAGYLRFQIAILAILHVFIWRSRRGGKWAKYFSGMFDLPPARAAAVAAGASLLALALVTTANLVFLHGPERFGVPRLGSRVHFGLFGLERPATVFVVAAAVPVVWILVRLVVRSQPKVRTALAVAGGAAVAAAVGWIGLELGPWISPWAARLPWFHWQPRGFWSAAGTLYPGHAAAVAAAGATGVLYLAAGAWTGWRIKHLPRTPVTGAATLPIPALGWVMALLLAVGWTLGGLAFLLDGHGISTLLLLSGGIAGYYVIAQPLWIERHSYRAYRRTLVAAAATPGEILSGLWKTDRRPVVVICASGGGIHAAAWCAHLLEELERRVPDFRSRVALTSSVSGGSVGCFYFQAAHGRSVPNGELFRMAASSSLDFAAWGFVFRDLLRYVIPMGDWFRVGNRSWALEKAWRRFQVAGVPEDWLDVRLECWRAETSALERPAAVFNATLVETGERFVIATADLGVAPGQGRQFLTLYPEHTVRASTAANLSAAFPLVSPAASIWTGEEPSPIPKPDRYHVVDGGYYDNFGIVSALDFLESGLGRLPEEHRRGKNVVLLRIEGFRRPPDPPNSGTGLLFQPVAPLKTMFGMRSSSQRARNELELELATERWRAQGVGIETVGLRYPHPGAPLSWHLTDKQKQAILAAGREAGKELDRVAELLGRA